MRTTAWGLFHRCFKEGEQVLVIDDEDKVHWGKLVQFNEDGLYLKNPTYKKDKYFKWYDLVFISHDGFPIRKLEGADGSRLIEKIDATHVQKLMREFLTKDICPRCDELIEYNELKYDPSPNDHRKENRENVHIVRSDPFLIENVNAELFNPGNIGPEHWGEDSEESLILTAKDGAMAQVYQLENVFHFEVTA